MSDIIFIFFLLSGILLWGAILFVILKIWLEK
jgi:hypothetical protein